MHLWCDYKKPEYPVRLQRQEDVTMIEQGCGAQSNLKEQYATEQGLRQLQP